MPDPGTVTACGLCGCPELTPVLNLEEQPVAERYGTNDRYPLALIECGNCGLVQLDYIVDPAVVFASSHPYTTGSTKALREHFWWLARKLEAGLSRGDVVADLGANDGTLLAAYSSHLERVAVEPTGQAERCRENGFTTYQEPFTAELAGRIREDHDGGAKVVTACNVLAHVQDPHDFAEGMAVLLADDGVAVVEVHDVASVTEGLQIDAIYHEHLFYWSVGTLSFLLAQHGLDVTEVERIGTHGGSWRLYARKRRTADLQERAEAAAKALRALLDGAAQEGPVYGIGATTRATPLIHYAQIAGYLSCVCEVPGSEKVGLTMPGTQIPVVDEAKLIADQPPYALLLSWHWADSIVPSLRRKGYSGKVIVPLPEPRVIDG